MQRIFVGIPVLNRFDLLDKAIEALDYESIELFIVNNNTVDAANTEAFHKLKDKYKFDSYSPRFNLGVAASWNHILATAWSRNYDFIYMGSNDTFLHPGTLRTLVEMEKPEIECLWLASWFHFWCMRLSAIPKIGLFDENFMPAYYEDNDCLRRIQQAGLQVVHMREHAFEMNGRMVPGVGAVALHSQTINSDPEYAALNYHTFHENQNYYLRKWGGQPEYETFANPFNDPNNTVNRWPDPNNIAAKRDWDNNRRSARSN